MSEQAKPTPPTQEHPYPPPAIVQYLHQAFNGAPYPPPGPPGSYMPPFFAYPPPPDGSHPEDTQNGVPGPLIFGLPPGVMYVCPPQPQAQSNPAPAALSRPKRKQVNVACTNCAGVCKRCDENRPCERCIKYGVADTCIDGQRKERKKGTKRGPYKRKSKGESDGNSFNGEWTPGSQTPSTSTTAAAIRAVAQYTLEGFYPTYYPPPGAFMPHPHEGQPGPDGSPPHANGQPIMPYYIHPGSYPPFPHYFPMYPQASPLPPGAPQQSSPQPPQQPAAAQPPEQPQTQPQPQTINPADAAKKAEESPPSTERNGVEGMGTGKKRPRTMKNGELKAKKAKVVVAPTTLATAAAAVREKGKEDEAAIAEQPVVNGEGELDKGT
ncbi:hypothetical protein BDZ97DRAFT_1844781 [Flammula alnicola]|nr:hypothetical protein BDZ97DRAFT_1844781 [Flammula alnicola]